MTIRTDITIDWSVSPRLITILSPSVLITIQDLVDTLRDQEDEMINLTYSRLINAAGKEPLGGGVSVGITATLQNALLQFQDRPGPNWILCNITGGNLVAVDSGGNPIDPRQPTAFVTIDRTASSSATLQDSEALQAASYGTQHSVALDMVNGTSGTGFPQGTREFPVDTEADALTIAVSRGIHDILVVNSATLTADFSEGYRFFSDNPERVMVTISAGADVTMCVFETIGVTGDVDAAVILRDCHVGNITSFSTGDFHNCLLQGTITLSGVDDDVVSFVNCTSDVPGATHSSFPVLDIAGTAEEVIVRNYSGGLGIINNTDGTNEMAFDFTSGRLDLAASVTAGKFHVYGSVTIADSSTGSTIIIDHTVEGVTKFNQQLLRNKSITDPVTGVQTVYEDDSATVLVSGQLYEGADTAQTYRGQGAERRERLT